MPAFSKRLEILSVRDIISVVGDSGELYTSGPHLHFEIWYKGSPLDPEKTLFILITRIPCMPERIGIVGINRVDRYSVIGYNFKIS